VAVDASTARNAQLSRAPHAESTCRMHAQHTPKKHALCAVQAFAGADPTSLHFAKETEAAQGAFWSLYIRPHIFGGDACLNFLAKGGEGAVVANLYPQQKVRGPPPLGNAGLHESMSVCGGLCSWHICMRHAVGAFASCGRLECPSQSWCRVDASVP